MSCEGFDVVVCVVYMGELMIKCGFLLWMASGVLMFFLCSFYRVNIVVCECMIVRYCDVVVILGVVDAWRAPLVSGCGLVVVACGMCEIGCG